VLRGERTIRLRRTTAAPARRRKGRSSGAEAAVDSPLFERLREWRAAVAREHGVPAYVVFHDGTLRAIAAARPSNLEQLAGISGVGEKKLERYGSDLIGLIGASA
jgi:ATP-dependent DNA helicase RecQ